MKHRPKHHRSARLAKPPVNEWTPQGGEVLAILDALEASNGETDTIAAKILPECPPPTNSQQAKILADHKSR